MRNLIRSAALAATLGAAGVAQAQEDITITLVPGLTTDAFYITMNKGAQAAAEALGITVEFQGAEEFDPVLQTPVLDAVIARGPDAILIAPTDSTQMIEPLRRANEAGIPIITVDTFIDDGRYQDGAGDGDFPLAYVASDNIGGGRMAARFMAEAMGGEGKVYVSNVRPGISTTDQREEGFKAEMAENFPGIEVLDTQYNENDASLAASQFQAVLARSPDIGGVFGANLFSALGAGNGVEGAGKADDITVIAFDAPQSIVDNISSGLVDAAIAQHPAEIGYFGVMAAYAALTGQSVPTTIGTGFTVINADNVGDESIAKFIYSE
jgi:ribose transport system substrate-binding protein